MFMAPGFVHFQTHFQQSYRNNVEYTVKVLLLQGVIMHFISVLEFRVMLGLSGQKLFLCEV